MNYKSIVKYILDNFVFTTLNTEFKYPYEETEFGNEIPNNFLTIHFLKLVMTIFTTKKLLTF